MFLNFCLHVIPGTYLFIQTTAKEYMLWFAPVHMDGPMLSCFIGEGYNL